MAGLLLATNVFNTLSTVFTEPPVTQIGPVTPGDQTRDYRKDKRSPSLLHIEDPSAPSDFAVSPDQLTFSEQETEAFGRVLLLEGAIEQGDANRFDAFLSGVDRKPDLVALHSPGGSVSEAQAIGRLIRRKKLSTAVLARANCLSSCPYILAGGQDRIVSLRAIIGMHQHYYEQPRYIPVMFAVEDIQTNQGETMQFLIEMGIAPSLMLYSLKTPPEQIYALIKEELVRTKLATEIVDD